MSHCKSKEILCESSESPALSDAEVVRDVLSFAWGLIMAAATCQIHAHGHCTVVCVRATQNSSGVVTRSHFAHLCIVFENASVCRTSVQTAPDCASNWGFLAWVALAD
jgi:hypothetical protein